MSTLEGAYAEHPCSLQYQNMDKTIEQFEFLTSLDSCPHIREVSLRTCALFAIMDSNCLERQVFASNAICAKPGGRILVLMAWKRFNNRNMNSIELSLSVQSLNPDLLKFKSSKLEKPVGEIDQIDATLSITPFYSKGTKASYALTPIEVHTYPDMIQQRAPVEVSVLTINGVEASPRDHTYVGVAVMSQDDHEQLRQKMASRFEPHHKEAAAVIIQHLNVAELVDADAILDAVESGILNDRDSRQLADAFGAVLADMQDRTFVLYDEALTKAIRNLGDIIREGDTSLSHRFKLSVPIVPFFLSYEGDLPLKSLRKFRDIWSRLVNKVRHSPRQQKLEIKET